MSKKSGAYRAYDALTGEELGRFDQYHEGHYAFPDRAVEVVYRPSKRKPKK